VKKIFVGLTYIQQSGDKVLYQSDNEYVALSVSSVTPYKAFRIDVSKEEDAKVVKNIKRSMTMSLNAICDAKSIEAKVLIAGMHISFEQMEEYKLVEDAVDTNNVDFFTEEAKFIGSTAQVEFDKAKEAVKSYRFAYDSFKKLIRIFRRVVSFYIKNQEFEIARKMIDSARLIGLNDDGSAIDGSPKEILTVAKEQVIEIIMTKGDLTNKGDLE